MATRSIVAGWCTIWGSNFDGGG